ncbi:VanZ family protein [Calothrix sp. UHCC 0171]|uniref:VanZ family protein n=1 Tax=Calothrix sp. UHCC 0171 TaxID=3110245 RepID=UPI002B218C88|nr:VanZ family protein [Calothrix sp. UHCC 0171]MEA5569589.1 VanZ family protein [Calothrix sp. UHCC 0171]
MRKNDSSVTRYFGFPIDVLIVIISVVCIIIATLYPFNFSIPPDFSWSTIFDSFDNTSFFDDQVNNILLFMPLGFSVGSILHRNQVQLFFQIILVVIIGASLSFSVELSQSFLASRSPTPEDILNNTIGNFVGLACFYICDSHRFNGILTKIENSSFGNSKKQIIFLFSAYIILTFLVGISWQNQLSLSSWSQKFPLILGNEGTGDRPWQGYISQIGFTDKAMSKNQIEEILTHPNYLAKNQELLIGNYQFDGKNNYRDTRGNLPDLLWQEQLSTSEDDIQNRVTEKGVTLTPISWLKSAEPAQIINKKIRTTSEFTVITNLATTNYNQAGPARIISLSRDTLNSNLTIGQERKDFALRLRTPLTGGNGANIKIDIPNVFADTNNHQFVITYSQGIVSIYIDKFENYYRFNLLELLPNNQKVLSYAITFLPLGLCLALISIIGKRKFCNLTRLIFITGIILPSLIVESILINITGKNFNLINIAMGVFFTACIALILPSIKAMKKQVN